MQACSAAPTSGAPQLLQASVSSPVNGSDNTHFHLLSWSFYCLCPCPVRHWKWSSGPVKTRAPCSPCFLQLLPVVDQRLLLCPASVHPVRWIGSVEGTLERASQCSSDGSNKFLSPVGLVLTPKRFICKTYCSITCKGIDAFCKGFQILAKKMSSF